AKSSTDEFSSLRYEKSEHTSFDACATRHVSSLVFSLSSSPLSLQDPPTNALWFLSLDNRDRDLVLKRENEKLLDYNNSFLGEYECSSLALDREEMGDEKEEIGSLETRLNNVIDQEIYPLADQTNAGKTCGGSYPPLPTHGTTPAGNTPGKSSYANVIGESSKKAVNIRTLFTQRRRNGIDVVVPCNPDVDLLKEDVGNVPVWVKLYGVPITAFSEDGLSVIAKKLGNPLMLDSYNSDMCLQSWGRSSYARVMIELRADVELKDTIVVAMSKIIGEEYYTCTVRVEYEGNPLGVSVGPKVGFKPHKEYKHVPKKSKASSTGNKKKCVEPINEVSNSNPFEVLNSVDNDVKLGTNGETTNLANNGANQIDKFEDLIISGQVIIVDEAGNPLKKVECSGDYDSEYEVTSVDNDMARSMASKMVEFGTQNPYDDDMYEGQDISQEIQVICDNLDVRVRGRKKK
nr:hypothetical protein [Tanacetum cinerariifolium]